MSEKKMIHPFSPNCKEIISAYERDKKEDVELFNDYFAFMVNGITKKEVEIPKELFDEKTYKEAFEALITKYADLRSGYRRYMKEGKVPAESAYIAYAREYNKDMCEQYNKIEKYIWSQKPGLVSMLAYRSIENCPESRYNALIVKSIEEKVPELKEMIESARQEKIDEIVKNYEGILNDIQNKELSSLKEIVEANKSLKIIQEHIESNTYIKKNISLNNVSDAETELKEKYWKMMSSSVISWIKGVNYDYELNPQEKQVVLNLIDNPEKYKGLAEELKRNMIGDKSAMDLLNSWKEKLPKSLLEDQEYELVR